jgi:hypothetical protein
MWVWGITPRFALAAIKQQWKKYFICGIKATITANRQLGNKKAR